MPAKKKVTLQELIGQKVMIQQEYADRHEGPLTVLAVDDGFIKLQLDQEVFWWNLKGIAGLREGKESDAITED